MLPTRLSDRSTPVPVTVLLTAVLLLAPALVAQEAEETPAALPRIHVIATGGTIASVGYVGTEEHRADDLVQAVPELAEVARITSEDPFTLPSSALTPRHLLELSQLVRKRLEEDPELAGVVVTQGTDSLEESAFFLDLLHGDPRPLVVTGAMRRPGRLAAEGGRNLLNAVRLAASPAMRDLGVLVTLNDEIHAAREVQKVRSTGVHAFASPSGGALGFLDDRDLFLLRRPHRRLSLAGEAMAKIEPAVELVVMTAGSDGRPLRDAAKAGVKSVVIEAFGRANMPSDVIAAIGEVRRLGVRVALVSRTRRGPLAVDAGWIRGGVLFGEDLDGLKARIFLIVALGVTEDPAVLQGWLNQLAGRIPPP